MEYMVKRSPHAVYDLKYHIVFAPKYRKSILVGPIEARLRELLKEISEEYGFELREAELMPDHVHLLVEVAPRWSPARVVQVYKSVTAREIFREFPRLRERLWAGELWSDGYYVASVGDKITTEMVKRYIRHQRQLTLKL